MKLLMLFCFGMLAYATDTDWKWVHAGVAAQLAGNTADFATSWKQPEATKWLQETSGPYQGRFYRRGAAGKIAVSGCVTAVSYLVAWKWPKSRKYVGILNLSLGATFGGVAASNYIRNPYFRN